MTIGDALGSDTAEAEVAALADLIKNRLIRWVENIFGQNKTYFLPISAQGENVSSTDFDGTLPSGSERGEAGGGKLGYPPNSKLAEYAFILPVLLAFEEESSRVSPATSM